MNRLVPSSRNAIVVYQPREEGLGSLVGRKSRITIEDITDQREEDSDMMLD